MEKNIEGIIEIAKNNLEEYGEFLPYLGKLFRIRKDNQFNKRIKSNEDKLKNIYLMIPDESFEYFGLKIGESVIQNILMDEEDEKAEFLLLGFENTVRKQITNYDVTLSFFDMICDLRSADIKRLLALSRRTEVVPGIAFIGSEEETFINYVDKKLENKGLILRGKRINVLSGEAEEVTDLSKVKITKLGDALLDFMDF